MTRDAPVSGPSQGFILSAPGSGSGKTTVTLGVLRALRNLGYAVRSCKSGPDYIDPRFHEAASGRPCFNLDAWSMPVDALRALAARGRTPNTAHDGDILVIEGAMGLFDGAPPDGRGATADLARALGLPVVFVVDAARMSQSIAPLVAGFARFDPDVHLGGIILNNVGSRRHETMLRDALAPLGIPVLGAILRDATLALPARHLGLVQADEHPELEAFLNRAAARMATSLDLGALAELGAPLDACDGALPQLIPPPAPHIAIAQDAAFSFMYPHLIESWRAAGVRISFFSPLANAPVPPADFVWLPGGYPELWAKTLAGADTFQQSLRACAANGVPIFGECGGYMVLGETLTDKTGKIWPMTGLLPLETSFAKRKLHLGYRRLIARTGPFRGKRFAAHEFHYATTLRAESSEDLRAEISGNASNPKRAGTGGAAGAVPLRVAGAKSSVHESPQQPTQALFDAQSAEGLDLEPMGLCRGTTSGSFAHLIAVTD